MKAAETTGKTADQLRDMETGLRKELFNLRFQRATGELASTARFRSVRRDIARVCTAMNMPETDKAKAPAKAKKAAPKKASKKNTEE